MNQFFLLVRICSWTCHTCWLTHSYSLVSWFIQIVVFEAGSAPSTAQPPGWIADLYVHYIYAFFMSHSTSIAATNLVWAQNVWFLLYQTVPNRSSKHTFSTLIFHRFSIDFPQVFHRFWPPQHRHPYAFLRDICHSSPRVFFRKPTGFSMGFSPMKYRDFTILLFVFQPSKKFGMEMMI